ncbi:MAG: radical SAM protein [Crocinitomicaceae bacterium]
MDYLLDTSEIDAYNSVRPIENTSSVCHAPSSSMYIGVGGMITSCCVNRTYLLGRYPLQSLEESWFGQKRDTLKKCMKQGDLSKGCQVCYDAIKGKNYKGLTAKVYDKFNQSDLHYPKKIDFELSNKCNLECTICRGERSSSIRKNREKLPPIKSPYDDEFLKQLDPFLPHLEDCHFLGGEPFLIPIYLDIWERMSQVNDHVKISIQTNATILTDRVKRIIETMNFDISVSIDSVDAELFPKIRVNGRFDVVLKNLEYFNDYCRRKGTQLGISYTPILTNWHELPDAVRFCNERDIILFFNTLSHPRHLALKELSPGKLTEILGYLREVQLPSSTELERKNLEVYRDFANLVEYWRDEATKRSDAKPVRKYQTVDAFFEDFYHYLTSQEGNEDDLYSNIRSKIESILTIAEDHNNYAMAEEFILALDFETLVRYVPESSLEELIISFESGVGQLRTN